VLWFGLWWACTGGDAFERCRDATCRAQAALETWEAAPEQVNQWVRSLDEPLEKAAVVNHVVQAKGMGAISLCLHLSETQLQERCRRLANRPHLRDGG